MKSLSFTNLCIPVFASIAAQVHTVRTPSQKFRIYRLFRPEMSHYDVRQSVDKHRMNVRRRGPSYPLDTKLKGLKLKLKYSSSSFLSYRINDTVLILLLLRLLLRLILDSTLYPAREEFRYAHLQMQSVPE